MIAQAPERSPEKWRDIAAMHGVEFSHGKGDTTAAIREESGRDAA